MIEIVNSVIDQKGTPAFYSDVYANRPNFGYPGRVFISTDTYQIFQDTGTSWILISDAGSGSSNLEQVTTNGNTTDKGIVITANGINATGINEMLYTNASYAGNTNFGLYANVNTTFQTTAPTGGNSLASVIGTANYTFSSSLTISNSTPIDGIAATPSFTIASGQTLSFTQKGNSFRGLAGLRSTIFANNSQGTLSHAAGLLINGYYDPSSAGTLTNYFGLVVNDSNEYGFGTVTNRYGIAQTGTGDNNYFLGKMLLGSSVDQGAYQLQVTGQTLLTGSLSGTTANFSSSGGGSITLIGQSLGNYLQTIYKRSDNTAFRWTIPGSANMYLQYSTDGFNTTASTLANFDNAGNLSLTGALTATSGTFNSNVYIRGPLNIAYDNSGLTSQLIINGSSNTNQQLVIGYNTTSDYGYIQAVKQGVAYEPLILNRDGGNVLIGTSTDAGYKLQVNGALLANTGLFNNGSLVVSNSGSSASTLSTGNSNIFWSIGIDTDNFWKLKQVSYGYTPIKVSFGVDQTVTFAGSIAINNGVTASVLNTVTNKIQIVVGGTTYYLLASTSNA